MLVCTHTMRGFFTRKHITLAERFSVLATQALHNVELYRALKEERNRLDLRVMERTRELAHARDEALEASRLKSELLAKVSHELRTPLNAILGYAEMLQEGIYGRLTEKQINLTRLIMVNSGELLLRINDLLDQAQMEAGTLILKYNHFRPATLIDGMQATLSVLAQSKGLALTGEVAPEVPATVWLDQRRLQQVIINMVNNAIKSTQQGGIHVRIHLPQPSTWAIEVSDTGAGTPAEAQSYIFEPFRQVDGSETRQNPGVGLGLSIVKQIVTMMNGRIELESEAGKGSTFTVFLPLANVEEREPAGVDLWP